MMEGIVFGIAQINFQQSLMELSVEKSEPNCMASSPASAIYLTKSDVQDDGDDDVFGYSGDTTADDGWEEAEDVESDSNKSSSRKNCTFAERRQLPTRASKESSILGIKRRTIMKPSKRSQSKHKDFNNLKPADIKKIYLNKKLTNFRPSSLETIFEEPLPNQNDLEGTQEQVRLIGARKIRRSLSCSDGYKLNKTLVNKRRAKIKKTFGRRFALKKISLEEFLDKLNSSIDKSEPALNQNEQLIINSYNTDHQTTLNIGEATSADLAKVSLSILSSPQFVTDSS